MEISSFTLFTIDIYIPLPIKMNASLCCFHFFHDSPDSQRWKQGIQNGISIIFGKIKQKKKSLPLSLCVSEMVMLLYVLTRCAPHLNVFISQRICKFSILFDSMFIEFTFHLDVDYFR